MSLVMIRSIVRPEKADEVLEALKASGFPAVTKITVAGRGRQRGIKIGDVTYNEIPKVMLISVVPAEQQETVVKTVMASARTGQGNFGDGKIFACPVGQMYTISTGGREA